MAEAAERRAERERMARTSAGRWLLAKMRREFIGPPTYRQWLRAAYDRKRKAEAIAAAKVAPPALAAPSEEALAARKAAALAAAAEMLAKMRAPLPPT